MAALFLGIGVLLRLLFPGDMEWKFDEQWLFDSASKVQAGGDWPKVGMNSSQGVPNPGFSAWFFILLGYVAKTPLQMVFCVQLLNALALIAFFFYLKKIIPEKEREGWLWGMALFSVSNLPVLYSRKIWQQCVLFPFSFVAFVAYRNRERVWGAFLLGALLLLMGQIHMSGFIILFFFVLSRFLVKEKTSLRQAISFLTGIALAALPMIPWLREVFLGGSGRARMATFHWIPRFALLENGLKDAWGLNLSHQFHLPIWKWPFPNEVLIPLILFHALLLVMGGYGFVQLIWKKRYREEYWASYRPYGIFFCIIYGVFYGFLSLPAYPHYWIIAYPFLHIGTALTLYPKRGLLVLFIGLQLILTLGFMGFIHVTGGVPGSEYGITYQRQLNLK